MVLKLKLIVLTVQRSDGSDMSFMVTIQWAWDSLATQIVDAMKRNEYCTNANLLILLSLLQLDIALAIERSPCGYD